VHGALDEPALALRDVAVSYGDVEAVAPVTLDVEPGELVALVGPNGAGKTSLLRAVLGLVPHAGEVVIHGRTCDRRGHRLAAAYVPQRLDLDLEFPITVEQVVGCARRPFRAAPWRGPGARRRVAVRDRQAIARALSRVGADGLERRSIGSLSGGQLQRVLLARALAQEADVLLLDEPLTGVDEPTSGALVDLLAALAADGVALLVTTHDLALVRARFGRCIALSGRVVADGSPSEVLRAAVVEAAWVR